MEHLTDTGEVTMSTDSWEEHITALSNILLSLQRELRVVKEERDRLLGERDMLLEERKKLATESNNPAPQERLWIPAEEPPQ